MCSYDATTCLWVNLHPFLASASACSLPFILAWPLILCNDVVCVRACSILTLNSRITLSRGLLCGVQCLIWAFCKCKTFRRSLKICVGSSWYVVAKNRRVWCIAINVTHRMVCNPGSLSAMLRSLMGLWIL